MDYDDTPGAETYYFQKPGETRVNLDFDPEALKIYVATQAVQAAGFDILSLAFGETFGTISKTNHPWYAAEAAKPNTDVNGNTYTWEELVTAKLVTVSGSTLTKVHMDVEQLVIPDSITVVGINAAYNNTNLKSIVFPSSSITIMKHAFYNTGIEEITIPGNVKLADKTKDDSSSYCNQFSDCKKLTKVVIEAGVKAISNSCFKGCSALTSVTVPSSVTAIYTSAFRDCSSLESIELPARLKDTIHKYAFLNTPAKNNITYIES